MRSKAEDCTGFPYKPRTARFPNVLLFDWLEAAVAGAPIVAERSHRRNRPCRRTGKRRTPGDGCRRLLRFARIGPPEHHRPLAESDMRHLHVTVVPLISTNYGVGGTGNLAGYKAQRHETCGRRALSLASRCIGLTAPPRIAAPETKRPGTQADDQHLLAFIAGYCDDPRMSYPGGKGRAFHAIINLMPPHDTYIETHLGSGAVMLRKRPARRSIGVDIDPRAISAWPAEERSDVELVLADAVTFLGAHALGGDELVYCDPPYWPGCRKRARCYRHDYSERDHLLLLDVLEALSCRVILSGYRSPKLRPTPVGLAPEGLPSRNADWIGDGINLDELRTGRCPPRLSLHRGRLPSAGGDQETEGQ